MERLCEDGRVVFGDGSSILADTIIYCTGFNYSFPFLDTEGAVTVDDNCVGPLFEHVFPPSLAPSLSFVGIPVKVREPVGRRGELATLHYILTILLGSGSSIMSQRLFFTSRTKTCIWL